MNSQWKSRIGAALLVVGAVFVLGFGQKPEPAPPQNKKISDEKSKGEETIYGNTPEDLKPFAKYVSEPYKKFWVPSDNPVEFWGPGRDKPEPEVDTVKIGIIAPITRSYETYIGQSVLHGMQMAIDDANASGGYKGKKFETVLKNDTGLWGAPANEIITLTYDDKVWAVIGTVDGANTHIAIRVALRTEIPIMNVADLDPTLVETKIPWIVRVIPDDRQMTYTIAYYVYKQLGLNSVAILRANNRYGRFGVTQFRKSSIKLGKPAPIEINYEPNYDKVNPNFDVQMSRLAEVNPDAVVLWADAEAAGVLVKKIRERGMKFPIFACERIVHPDFLKAAGPAAEGVVATYPMNLESRDPKYLEFVKRYEERFQAKPDCYAVHSYDGTMITVEAIRKAGLNRYRIMDAMAMTKHWDGISGPIDLDEALSNRRPVTVATVKDGKFVFGLPKMNKTF
ncbi:MAG TPA: ABC transporter substrate-binding protein [Acidobacteriota bacterium]|nr:ABC transporter substrate-binding protein [Acidobacteriota bacterium]